MGKPYDLVQLLSPLTKQGWAWEGPRLKPTGQYTSAELPWVYHNVEFDCTVWNRIFHTLVAKEKLVHSHCHNCIKIVAKPKTLRDLAAIEKLQASMLYPCKCGIDRREWTSAIYGAYWYNRGFEEALHRYKILVKKFEENELSHVPLIIKKACTEFELHLGPTPNWAPPTEEQLEMERDLDNTLDYRPYPPTMVPATVVNHTHHLWVQWAYEHGDETYLDFTNGQRLYPELVTYHEALLKAEEDE